MTAGDGISHSEYSVGDGPVPLDALQFWVVLPESSRRGAPGFEQHTSLPSVMLPADSGSDADATVVLGEFAGVRSPATVHTPIVGADLALAGGADVRLRLERDFEYAVLSMSGEAHVDGVPVLPGSMLYLGCGRTELPLRAESDADLMLLGGEPFTEPILMWWNFVARDRKEIEAAYRSWQAEDVDRFGRVTSPLARIPAKAPWWLPDR